MTETEDVRVIPEAPQHGRRLRMASLAFNTGTWLIVAVPALNQLGLFKALGIHWPYPVAAILLWLWGSVVLARDPRLKVLMPFGTRSHREAVAHALPRKVVLDEFDFHLRGEAFRISYQIVASLVALTGTVGAFLYLGGIPVKWGPVLALTFPFGILWLLGLPTSVIVWLTQPAGSE